MNVYKSLKNQNGIGILDTLMAAAFFMVIAYFMFTSTQSIENSSNNPSVGGQKNCDNATRFLATKISQDSGNLKVRSGLPNLTTIYNERNASDPLGGLYADKYPLIESRPSGADEITQLLFGERLNLNIRSTSSALGNYAYDLPLINDNGCQRIATNFDTNSYFLPFPTPDYIQSLDLIITSVPNNPTQNCMINSPDNTDPSKVSFQVSTIARVFSDSSRTNVITCAESPKIYFFNGAGNRQTHNITISANVGSTMLCNSDTTLMCNGGVNCELCNSSLSYNVTGLTGDIQFTLLTTAGAVNICRNTPLSGVGGLGEIYELALNQSDEKFNFEKSFVNFFKITKANAFSSVAQYCMKVMQGFGGVGNFSEYRDYCNMALPIEANAYSSWDKCHDFPLSNGATISAVEFNGEAPNTLSFTGQPFAVKYEISDRASNSCGAFQVGVINVNSLLSKIGSVFHFIDGVAGIDPGTYSLSVSADYFGTTCGASRFMRDIEIDPEGPMGPE